MRASPRLVSPAHTADCARKSGAVEGDSPDDNAGADLRWTTAGASAPARCAAVNRGSASDATKGSPSTPLGRAPAPAARGWRGRAAGDPRARPSRDAPARRPPAREQPGAGREAPGGRARARRDRRTPDRAPRHPACSPLRAASGDRWRCAEAARHARRAYRSHASIAAAWGRRASSNPRMSPSACRRILMGEPPRPLNRRPVPGRCGACVRVYFASGAAAQGATRAGDSSSSSTPLRPRRHRRAYP